MGASTETPLDASNIATRLWVGGQPQFDRDLPEFDVLVLCAQEIQPKVLAYRGTVIRVPLPDSHLTDEEVRRALVGGRQVAESLARGKRVLSTCYAGLNRSALVASLGLGLVSVSAKGRPARPLTPIEIILLMRERRGPAALHNPHFCEIITRFVGSRRTPAIRPRT